MNALILVLVGLVGLIMAGGLIFLAYAGKGGSTQGNLSRIVAAQRRGAQGGGGTPGKHKRSKEDIYDVAQEAKVEKVVTSVLTLEKKLKYAQWRIPPIAYHMLVLVISAMAVFLMSIVGVSPALVVLAVITGPISMGWLLNLYMDLRYKQFDRDYPAFLSSIVSLLKTGMDSTTAIETAADGLEEGSLVKEEVNLMLERLRFGVAEEKSIGSFGEDIYHPEIELFVQALLLSRRVGGNLSDTLNRLGRQVRRRQYFRKSAVAAIGMQKGSIWVILSVIMFLQVVMFLSYPDLVMDSWKDKNFGWQMWQVSIVLILLGIFWVRQVTKLKI
jgi:tight adherence protein B